MTQFATHRLLTATTPAKIRQTVLAPGRQPPRTAEDSHEERDRVPLPDTHPGSSRNTGPGSAPAVVAEQPPGPTSTQAHLNAGCDTARRMPSCVPKRTTGTERAICPKTDGRAGTTRSRRGRNEPRRALDPV